MNMHTHNGLEHLPTFKNAVLTIGTYDGVHFGHQKIIRRITEIAKEIDGESVMLTFDPHPRLVLNPYDERLKLISTIDEKIELLDEEKFQKAGGNFSSIGSTSRIKAGLTGHHKQARASFYSEDKAFLFVNEPVHFLHLQKNLLC